MAEVYAESFMKQLQASLLSTAASALQFECDLQHGCFEEGGEDGRTKTASPPCDIEAASCTAKHPGNVTAATVSISTSEDQQHCCQAPTDAGQPADLPSDSQFACPDQSLQQSSKGVTRHCQSAEPLTENANVPPAGLLNNGTVSPQKQEDTETDVRATSPDLCNRSALLELQNYDGSELVPFWSDKVLPTAAAELDLNQQAAGPDLRELPNCTEDYRPARAAPCGRTVPVISVGTPTCPEETEEQPGLALGDDRQQRMQTSRWDIGDAGVDTLLTEADAVARQLAAVSKTLAEQAAENARLDGLKHHLGHVAKHGSWEDFLKARLVRRTFMFFLLTHFLHSLLLIIPRAKVASFRTSKKPLSWTALRSESVS